MPIPAGAGGAGCHCGPPSVAPLSLPAALLWGPADTARLLPFIGGCTEIAYMGAEPRHGAARDLRCAGRQPSRRRYPDQDHQRGAEGDGHATGSRLKDLPGIGPIGAARILADVGDVTRFADRNRFASWSGTARLDASSGESSSGTDFRQPGTESSTTSAHGSDKPDPTRHRGPRLLPTQARRGQDAPRGHALPARPT